MRTTKRETKTRQDAGRGSDPLRRETGRARSKRRVRGLPVAQGAMRHEACPAHALRAETLERLAEDLQQMRMADGCALADRAWLEDPLDQWCANMEAGSQCLKVENQEALAVSMAQTLAVRDALILSMVGGLYGDRARSVMLDFVARPHDRSNVQLLYSTLTGAFKDASVQPDFERCSHGLSMLEPMTCEDLGRFCVQPCCVTGYALWWLDDPSARVYAIRALRQDDGCVLARVLLSAIVKGTRPAWTVS